jgi:hypothetical protein
VVGCALPGALLAVDERPRDPLGERRGREHEVDLEAAVALEALPVVVPESASALVCRIWSTPDALTAACECVAMGSVMVDFQRMASDLAASIRQGYEAAF